MHLTCTHEQCAYYKITNMTFWTTGWYVEESKLRGESIIHTRQKWTGSASQVRMDYNFLLEEDPRKT
jgi:hypothetical protein